MHDHRRIAADPVSLQAKGEGRMAVVRNPWIKFLRNYGPIPTNDNMYDESIQRALHRRKIQPLKLPAQFLDELIANFRSASPVSEILTGTAGDGKTYHCREAWIGLGGSEDEWLKGHKVQRLPLNGLELVVVKDLSELRADESADLLKQMALDVADAQSPRIYLIAANHGQLLEKLKLASVADEVARMAKVVEELLVTGNNPDPGIRLKLKDLSRAPATGILGNVIQQVTQHPGWQQCDSCAVKAGCPIRENRSRLIGDNDEGLLRTRLQALVEISEQNGIHFPIRQLLILVTNAILGHPDSNDGLMSCADVQEIVQSEDVGRASIFANLFGENLPPRRAERTDVFRKLNAFGIGGETSNAADNLLVYGADDPNLKKLYADLVLNDPVYGGTKAYMRAQQAYLESFDPDAQEEFLGMLRAQRQRLFFTLPEQHEADFELWDLTVFRYAGLFLKVAAQVHGAQPLDRAAMPLVMRGLNRLFTGVLVQNQDELILATSGSLSQSKRSPLLDETISVPRRQGEEVTLVPSAHGRIAVRVKVSRGQDPAPEELQLTPTRFEFLGRVAEGALPSSFSLECQEDLLAFKARLLAATQRRRDLDGDDEGSAAEIVLRFIDLNTDGSAGTRRVTVRV